MCAACGCGITDEVEETSAQEAERSEQREEA